MPAKLTPSHRLLIRRYLVWAYKSTKESFDRLERKTTQLMADDFIEKHLQKTKKPRVLPAGYETLVGEYKDYVASKKASPVDQGKYLYLSHRLEAIEAAITHYLGNKELSSIKQAYEDEFTRRIWESKEH